MMRAMHAPREHRYSDASALASALCEHIEIALQTALAARGRASLVVSGGRTPTPLFNRLAQQKLPWQDIAIANGLDPAAPLKRGQKLLIPTLIAAPPAPATTTTPPLASLIHRGAA